MSGELQRLAAQAEVAPIFRTHGGLVQSREGKELQRDLRDLGHRGVLSTFALCRELGGDVAEGAGT